MKPTLPWAMTAMLAMLATSAMANSACDKPRNDFDGLYCLNKVYGEADKELNERYGALAGLIDAEGKARLKASQLAWIERRNTRCSRREGSDFFVDLQCATSQTIERAEFLQSRIRECRSAGCQNSKLQAP